MTERHLLIVVCGAGPASDVDQLIAVAHAESWTAHVVATPSALGFIDTAGIETLTGFTVRSDFQPPTTQGGRRLPAVDALIVAPATYNTVNKLAAGIADTYALTSIAELIGRGVPAVVVPFVNSALAGRAPFGRAVAALREEDVRVLFGAEDGWEPHPPGNGSDRQRLFPWGAAFAAARKLADR
ncbi:MAG: flavoprotein [Actinobacteria bacterium 13_2_20CM_2_71_6]|nr:MAG: flavoprotein [Actinobacteria bacterium 13_2_20CM_2_71_6]